MINRGRSGSRHGALKFMELPVYVEASQKIMEKMRLMLMMSALVLPRFFCSPRCGGLVALGQERLHGSRNPYQFHRLVTVNLLGAGDAHHQLD